LPEAAEVVAAAAEAVEEDFTAGAGEDMSAAESD
jgi:hypothetical protein